MACRCGWDCNCTSLSGTRRCGESEGQGQKVKDKAKGRELTEKPKAVVLLSGGMDSCVTAAIAHQEHRLALVHASYGQRTERREGLAFEQIAQFYGVDDRLVARLEHFAQIGGSALTDVYIRVPESGPTHPSEKTAGIRDT